MNTLLNKKFTLFTFPKENMLPFIYGAKESMSSADWQIISNIQNYRNFLQVEISFFSVVEIPTKHSSLYHNYFFIRG